MKAIPCFQVSSLRFIQNMTSVMLAAKNMSALAVCVRGTVIGEMTAIIPKKSNSSIMRLPSRSPSPMLACFFVMLRSSTAMSGIVVPIPITVSATKYAGIE